MKKSSKKVGNNENIIRKIPKKVVYLGIRNEG